MADVTTSATASWDASATKDTTSALVVTPLKSLNFQYAEGFKRLTLRKALLTSPSRASLARPTSR
jgi:hypothetical protein